MQKLRNNEARPKFTGSYKKKACMRVFTVHISLAISPSGRILNSVSEEYKVNDPALLI